MRSSDPGIRFRRRAGLARGLVTALLVALAAWLLPAAAHAQGTPEQVAGVTAMADDHESVTVNWSAVPDVCGSEALYYQARWDDDTAFGSPDAEDYIDDAASSHRITGLTEGTEYVVQVRAICADLFGIISTEGAWSTADSATTDLQPPARASGLTVNSMTDTTVSLSWTMAIRADGYIVQWRTSQQTFDSSRQVAVAALTHTLTGLTPDTLYLFQVISARAGADDGPASSQATTRTDPAPTPARVTGVSATALSGSEIMVDWSAATHATGYVVEWDTDAAFPNPEQADAAGTKVIIEDLNAETEYHLRVYGTRAGAADGAVSATATATTLESDVEMWADRFPGGVVGAQLALAIFGGGMSGWRFRTMRTPRREALILLFMAGGSLILPFFGVGNLFWTGGIALLAVICSAAVFFLGSRA